MLFTSRRITEVPMEIKALRRRHPVHWRNACALRALAMDAVQSANSGHPGMPMGMADVMTVLFHNHLKYDASCPTWPDRDRFVLSAGHGSMLLYAALYLSGYENCGLDQIKRFRKLHSVAAGHPEIMSEAGIETTTGPLGQGLANAVGLAIAEEALRARFGKELVDHMTYAVVGDGCLMEGISQEAISFAGMQKLSKLVVLWDDNGISIDGEISKSDVTEQIARFNASGWTCFLCDGHDPEQVNDALDDAKESPYPALIACKTRIGLGSPAKEGTASAHGSPLGEDEIAAVREIYDWPYLPFEIPAEVSQAWATAGARGVALREQWEQRLNAVSSRRRGQFDRMLGGDRPYGLNAAFDKLKRNAAKEQPKLATRKCSEEVLKAINPILPEVIGGSADLTGSNNTKTSDLGEFNPQSRSGRYIHYGIREHGMAGAMNGMALHGGIRPYGGTFLCFSDYARGAIRLSALMGLPVIYVMTHDSIGLGEDGPTHQPVEHLAMLRATPNMHVFRPCDTVETAEAWQCALASMKAPSVIALSRQSLPTLRIQNSKDNKSSNGAYILRRAKARTQVMLLATGSETAIAVAARDLLEAKGIGTRVVSMPCWELFEAKDESYRKRVLPKGPIRIGIEAASRLGWDRWLCGERGSERKAAFIGMDGFGASAPGGDLFEHFGITAKAVVEKAESML